MNPFVAVVILFTGIKSAYSSDLLDKCANVNCECNLNKNESLMDCTAKHVNIREVCKFVEQFEIAVLLAGENNIGQLHSGLLDGCANLTVLDLHYNQIGKIKHDAFSNFKRLRRLDLRANNLNLYYSNFSVSILPKTVEVLKLGGNLQEGQQEDQFQYPDISSLLSLTHIYLDGSVADFGTEYENVTKLFLTARTRFTHCYLPKITNATFSNLIKVEQLNLSLCNISSISSGAFEKLTYLNKLDLSLNIRLGFNALGVFAYGLQFTNIEFLNYSHVYSTFEKGTELRKEHICYLTNTSLKDLVLDGNRINLVEPNAPILLPKTLERLYLNDNRPSFGPYLAQLGCLSNLIHFQGNDQNKYHNPFYYVIDAVFYNPLHDEVTFVSSCPFMTEENLRQIASERENCHYIESENFANMFNITFPEKLKCLEFKNINMKYKVNVKISIYPPNNSLTYADFSSNGLSSLTGSVGPFPNIKTLLLSDNFCENIGPSFFDNMTNLQNLDISDNYLGPYFATEESKTVFQRLSNLQTLFMARNKILSLFSETFYPLIMLETISLDENKLKVFEINIDNLKNLLVLSLAYNSISTIPEAIRSKLVSNANTLGQNFTLNLTGNELQFDCTNMDFLRWIYRHRENMKYFNNYTYKGPFPVGVLDDTSIDKLESTCSSYVALIVLCSIVLAVFFSVVTVGVVYRNRWKIRYFLYMSKAGLFGNNRLMKEQDRENYRFDAFISYAEENLRFIINELIPRLEGQGEDFSLCIHQRDFVAGNAVSDNITDAISKSRKTVIILSKMFIKKRWCMYEFNMARMESIYSRDSNSVVVVMLEDVPVEDMPLEMVEWIRNNSYIEYTTDEQGEALFWDKLKNSIMD